MNLQEVSSANGDLSSLVVKTMMAEHPLISKLEFYSMVGNADSLRKVSGATGGTVRALGSNYSGSDVTPDYATPSLKIFGDEIRTDQAYERRGADIVSVRKADLLAFARRATRNLANYAVNGTGAANQPTGLITLVDGAQKFYANTSSTALTLQLGNSDSKKAVQQKLLELLDTGITMVDGGAQFILLSSKMYSRVVAIARDNLTWRTTEFGAPIPSYNGVDFIPAGYTNAGAEIIAGDETHGTISETCYSIYFGRFGERSDITIATNNGLNVTDKGLVGANYVYNIDFDLEFALQNVKSLAKMEGLKLG